MFKVDVFISKQRPFDRSQFQRRVKVVVATHPERAAYVATPEDTILAKLEWYKAGQQASDRQWRDAIGVVQAQGSRLDTAYLRHWADVLGLSDLLERAMAYVKP
jgi:hypothetical protein